MSGGLSLASAREELLRKFGPLRLIELERLFQKFGAPIRYLSIVMVEAL